MFELWLLGLSLLLGLTFILLRVFNRSPKEKFSSSTIPLTDRSEEVAALQWQCQQLREQLQSQSQQLTDDFRVATFEQLQTLLTNYPTARQMAQAKPDLPARNLTALFTPLENLLESWGYQMIGQPWEQVPYNPQLHQPDTDDLEEGELVYVRFVGYREGECLRHAKGERILSPAKVSRTPPPGVELIVDS